MAIISFLGFVRKIHRKCLSPGANLRETACLSLQGAVIRRQPQAHQVYCTKTGGETPTWLSSYGTIILCPEFQRSCQPLFVLQPLLIKCTRWNNTNLISYLQLTLSTHKVLVWRVADVQKLKGYQSIYWWNLNCCSVAKSCPTLCDSMDCSMPGFSVLHHLPKFAQTYVHWVSAKMLLGTGEKRTLVI